LSSSKSRSGSCNPLGCLLFLIGLVSLIVGFSSGKVMEAVTDIQTNSPESSETLKYLVIWIFITFGPLGLGSFWIKSSGFGVSLLIFGLLLVMAGFSGLGAYFLGVVIPQTDNVFWQMINYLIGLTGSLMYTSIALSGLGIVLTFISMFIDSGQGYSSNRPAGGYMPTVTCEKCGHQNPVWSPTCEKCRAQLPLSKDNKLW